MNEIEDLPEAPEELNAEAQDMLDEIELTNLTEGEDLDLDLDLFQHGESI